MRPLRVSDQTAPSSAASDDARFWTTKKVAAFLGVSVRWVHERTRLGAIPCYRFGTLLRFDPEEVAAWVAKFHHSPKEAQPWES